MTSSVYFNDNEKFVAEWLRSLYPQAVVDGRSILDIQASDVVTFKRTHLFAGIGGWEYALQLAGWPEDRPVWTGSCPCQPFSAAGKRKGESDVRHLWPEMRRLIAECRPPVVFGEQVASKLGREWLAGVRSDLEKLGYAVGAADLCASSAGAPHIRQRLYWVADSTGIRRAGRRSATHTSLQGDSAERAAQHAQSRQAGELPRRPEGHSGTDGLADPDGAGSQGRLLRRDGTCERFTRSPGLGNWGEYDLIECADGKTRRIPNLESGVFPLASGVPARVGRIRAYGNAIVPPLAAVFIRAFLEAETCA